VRYYSVVETIVRHRRKYLVATDSPHFSGDVKLVDSFVNLGIDIDNAHAYTEVFAGETLSRVVDLRDEAQAIIELGSFAGDPNADGILRTATNYVETKK